MSYSWICWERESFLEGEFLNTIYNDGHIALAKGFSDGEYRTPIKETDCFRKLVAYWNAFTPEKSHIEVFVRVWHSLDEKPSAWYSWGLWGAHIDRRSKSITREEAPDQGIALDTDTLLIGEEWGTARFFQIKAILYSGGSASSPGLYLLGAAFPRKELPFSWPDALPSSAETIVPACSQLKRDPVFAEVICSAVTIQMLTGARGENFLPEEIAWCNYDSAMEGHGNWSFSVAMAGELGYRSAAAFITPEELLFELAEGRPVGASVSYSNNPNHESLPYLENSSGNTPGHLLVLNGYEKTGNEIWLLAADPYGESNEATRRKYRWEQFLKAWSNRLVYLVHEKRENFRQKAIERIPVLLQKEKAGVYAIYADGIKTRFAKNEIGSCVLLPLAEAEKKPLSLCDAFFGNLSEEGDLRIPQEAEAALQAGTLRFRVILADHRGCSYEGYLPAEPSCL